MSKFTKESLRERLVSHYLYIDHMNGKTDCIGKRLDLSGCNLSNVDLSGLNLSYANLQEADLEGANLYNSYLQRANLRGACLRKANLEFSNLEYADLRMANLEGANLNNAYLNKAGLRDVDFSYANLKNAVLVGADLEYAFFYKAYLSGANLSQSIGLPTVNDFISKLEKCEQGIIAYKTFGDFNPPNPEWIIAKGEVLEEVCNFDRTSSCGSGINVGTRKWVLENTYYVVWKCLIPWEWLAGVCVPYATDGKFRCEKIKLLHPVDRKDLMEEDKNEEE